MPINNWTRNLPDDTKLYDVTMPGSHDALVHTEAFEPMPRGGTRANSVCQHLNLYGQACAGSRFFDIRLAVDPIGRLRGIHSELIAEKLNMGGYGAMAVDMLTNADRFLEENPSEFIILRISHTKKETNITSLIRDHFVNQRLLKGASNIAMRPIGELRGKLIVCCAEKDFGGFINPALGIHGFTKYGTPLTVGGISTCGIFGTGMLFKTGCWSIPKVLAKAKKGQLEHQKHNPHDHLFQIYWQRTDLSGGLLVDGFTVSEEPIILPDLAAAAAGLPGVIPVEPEFRDLETAAQQLRNNVPQLIDQVEMTFMLNGQDLPADRNMYPNIVSYDFVNPITSTQIVALNVGLEL